MRRSLPALVMMSSLAACGPMAPVAMVPISVVEPAPAQPPPPPPPVEPPHHVEAPRREAGPLPSSPRPFTRPRPTVTALGGGFSLLVVERHELPLVELRLVIPAGSQRDPADRAGLANLTAQALRDGTKTRSHDKLVDDLALAGGALAIEVGGDHTVLSTRALAGQLDGALAALGDCVAHPAFAQAALDERKKEAIAERVRDEADPGFRAARAAAQLLAQSSADPSHKSLEAITRAEVAWFHGTFYRPEGAQLIVVGDVAPATIAARVKAAFASWKPTLPAKKVLKLEGITVGAPPLAIHLVPAPPSLQTRVVIAWPLPPASDPGRPALLIASQALNEALVQHHMRARIDDDVFVVEQRIYTPELATKLAGLLALIGRLRDGAMSDAELLGAREHLEGEYLVANDRLDALARLVEAEHEAGIAPDDADGLRGRIAKVDAAAVKAAAVTHLDVSASRVVVVGDPVLAASLGGIAPVTVEKE